ncbi:MAG: hypothetical protein KDA45_01260 [Planctomycetales bacterium]|nr:hypothetical protein [Planctomycetales bacterium]
MDHLNWSHNPRPGYRLKKLEVTNWGTFDSRDGSVTSLAPNGRTALLVGQNGSGKSTLVDALLTLLVQPGVRNYNVAAGAKKRERDERTYIRGACGRSSDDEHGSVTNYLRPDDKHYSALLACFTREDTGDAFSLVQILQITGDGEVDKTYAFSRDERSIAADLSGLKRGERIYKQLIDRGFQATTKYTEYLPWISRVTHMRPKAMDVFNQTVAVKDIQSLNRFIREHMLEPHPWRERIEGLLAHFLQLSQTHSALVKARRQIELLEPIEKASADLQRLSQEMSQAQQQLAAVDSFFRQQLVLWLRPRRTQHGSGIEQAQRRKLELQSEIDDLDDVQRALKNEIEKTGGQRMRQLPLLLETQQALLDSKNRERQRLQTALKTIDETLLSSLENRKTFAQLPERLEQIGEQLAAQSTRLAQRRLQLAKELTDVRTAVEEERAQISLLQQQPGNLPQWLTDIRAAMASELNLPEAELVFAGELISVAEQELSWQPAIEMVLRRFALSLLVADKYYRQVSRYIENTPLRDARGRGQRLVYIRVPELPEKPLAHDRLHNDSLLRKLSLRDEHPLSGWLRAELARRFNYRCCASLEQFQQTRGLAITKSRHIKFDARHHEKDDRPQSLETRRHVIGWDNAQRLQEVQLSLATLRKREQSVEQAFQLVESDSRKLSQQLAAIENALSTTDFDLIDSARHRQAIQKLDDERAAIENSNNAVRTLRQRLDETIERRFAAQKERDAQVAAESNLLRDNEQADRFLRRHEEVLHQREQDGSLQQHAQVFAALQEALADQLARASDVSQFTDYQQNCSQQIQRRLNHLSEQAEPLRADVIRAMQKFLSDSPEQREDLQADLRYSDGFLGLLDKLRQEDLPRHEQRFRERLNEKVIQELGVFHAALQCECQEILSKIEVLNASLEQLEYRPGTYMRLEPRQVADREIRDFQSQLRDCLNEHFDGDGAAAEQRFAHIERFIRRLREEERWRDKVTDVRRWFDFSARELERLGGQERSCYEDSSGQSGGEKAKLAFTILVAAIAYQFDIDPSREDDDRLHFVVVDEMFSKVDDRYAEYALQLFEKFGLQLLIVAPLDAKARVTEPYVGCYLHTVKNEATGSSHVFSLTADEYEQALVRGAERDVSRSPAALAISKPR